MKIKNSEEALNQLKTNLSEKALIRIAELSQNEKIQKVFDCPFQYPVLKHRIEKELG